MNLNITTKYEVFLMVIVVIKILFVFFFLLSKILEVVYKKNKNIINLLNKVLTYESYFEDIFNILMGFLLIHLFNPRKPLKIELFNYETKLLLFLFGILMILYFIRNLIKSVKTNKIMTTTTTTSNTTTATKTNK